MITCGRAGFLGLIAILLGIVSSALGQTTPVHRYSFNETGGTNIADSIGGPAWTGTLPNGGTLIAKLGEDFDIAANGEPTYEGISRTDRAAGWYVVYLENGSAVSLNGLEGSLPFRWFNPKTGSWVGSEMTSGTQWNTTAPTAGPWVLFAGSQRSKIH